MTRVARPPRSRPPRRGPSRLAALALVVALAASLLLAGPAGASTGQGGGGGDPGGARSTEPRRVLVVALPRVTWERFRSTDLPHLERFVDGAAVASTSVRTLGPRTDPGEAYATIGAGARAGTPDSTTDGQAADREELTPDGPATAVYQRRTGVDPTGEVLALTFPQIQARNRVLLYGAVPGSFGRALVDAGRGIAVVGNADRSLAGPEQRQVALAATDTDGQVPAGRVGPTLLVADDLAPFGVRADIDTYVNSVRSAWETADVVVVEASDLERAEQARSQSTIAEGERQFRRALRASDQLFGELLEQVDLERDLVIVVGPTSPLVDEQLTVFAMRGPGVEEGWARSASTRRDGFVTLTDIAPSVLGRMGIDVPKAMNDTPIRTEADDTPVADRIDRMVRDNARAQFRDDSTGPVTVGFIVLLVLMLALVAWSVSRRPEWAGPLQVLALTVLAVPSIVYLSGLLPYDPLVVVTYGLVVLMVAVAVAAVARRASRREPLVGPLALSGLAVLVLAVDVATGASLQINTMFGYSPIVAGRFAGFGNQAFAILTISTLVVATAGWELWQKRAPGTPRWVRVAVLVALFAAVVVVDGAPTLGSDVGGVLASVPAFAICALVLLGRRIHWRVVAVIVAATVAVLAIFAAIDLNRAADSRTHLGRFAQRLLDGEAVMILERKLQANMNQLTSTVWTIVIPAALAFFAYLAWRPNRMLRRIEARHPGFRAFEISGLTLGIAAWALNDSGVAIPAMMLTVALPYTAYLVVDVLRRGDGT